MRVIVGFIVSTLISSLIYTFWVIGDLGKYFRVLPIVLFVASIQAIFLAGPAYYWLKLKGFLNVKSVVLASIFVAVVPWLILQLISGLDHQTLKSGGKVLIENGSFTMHWWIRYFLGMVKLSFCGALAGLMFSLIINTSSTVKN